VLQGTYRTWVLEKHTCKVGDQNPHGGNRTRNTSLKRTSCLGGEAAAWREGRRGGLRCRRPTSRRRSRRGRSKDSHSREPRENKCAPESSKLDRCPGREGEESGGRMRYYQGERGEESRMGPTPDDLKTGSHCRAINFPGVSRGCFNV